MTTIATPSGHDVPLFRTVAFATSVQGRSVVTVELHGVLCAMTARQLRDELARLIEEGCDDIVIDLGDLDLCTSDGVDVFTDAGAVVDRAGGSIRLCGDRGVTSRVLDVIEMHDPSFVVHRGLAEIASPSNRGGGVAARTDG